MASKTKEQPKGSEAEKEEKKGPTLQETSPEEASNPDIEEAMEAVEESSTAPPPEPAKIILHKVQTPTSCHTILQMPHTLPQNVGNLAHKPHDTFNMVMVDVSGSMHSWWNLVLETWNEHISKKLIGITKIYTFGSEITFRREDTYLSEEDNDSSMTELTGAIETIGKEVVGCTQNFLRVFLITDGHHNCSEKEPGEAIDELKVPDGKIVEVFLIGVGSCFPVEYSISLRSNLHNGNANLPSIFWAEEMDDYENEIRSIADILEQGYCKFEISPPARVVPGLKENTVAHLGEFLYYPHKPEELEIVLELEEYGTLLTEITVEEPEISLFLDKIFRQWNSIVIQEHRKKNEIPHEAFDVMDDIYNHLYNVEDTNFKEKNTENDIETRLKRKFLKTMQVEYATLMNKSKTVIGIEGQYKTELELAQNILKTTVKSKYDTKNLKMKGHGEDDYKKDIKIFMDLVTKHKEDIMKLDDSNTINCCNVTFSSTITDLKDSSLHLLAQEDKFTFMRTFNATGIPIYAPIKDSSQINPWSIRVKKILASPYTIISQTTLELSAEAGATPGIEDKDIYLQEGDENSRFNAVVPVYTSDVAKCLKPILTSNIFQMVATFGILKNPHIIDHNSHIAALSAVWTKTVSEHPAENRPEYVKSRLEMIEATSEIYLDRRGIALYLDTLITKPEQALMTESKETFGTGKDEAALKCESLTKPIFFLHMIRNRPSVKDKLVKLFTLIASEYVGRCIAGRQPQNATNTKKNNLRHSNVIQQQMIIQTQQNIADEDEPEEIANKTELALPYSAFFASGKNADVDLVKEKVDEIVNAFKTGGDELLKQNYTRENLLKSIRAYALKDLEKQVQTLFNIDVNKTKVNRLRNASATGDLYWNSLPKLALEIGIPPEEVKNLFSTHQTLVYVNHALRFKNSRDRLDNPMQEYDAALKTVEEKVKSENMVTLKKKLIEQLGKEAESRWLSSYKAAHEALALPMSKDDLVAAASALGVTVDAKTVETIYKYNPVTGLARNTCMVPTCPYYLVPCCNYNQHISVDREQEGYPHCLHKVSREISGTGGKAKDVIDKLINPKLDEPKPKSSAPLPKKSNKQKRQSKKVLKKKTLENRRQPDPPSIEILNTLNDGIENLIEMYAKSFHMPCS